MDAHLNITHTKKREAKAETRADDIWVIALPLDALLCRLLGKCCVAMPGY
jgi:hypothetical protein